MALRLTSVFCARSAMPHNWSMPQTCTIVIHSIKNSITDENYYYYTRLTASFPGQPGYAGTNCILQQQQQQPFNGRLSRTTRLGRYQKKHSPAHTHPGQCTSFITFLHLQRSTASSLFSLCAWQSTQTTSFQVLFGLPLGLEPSTSYSMHFFTQSSSSFRSTCPYQYSLFCCNNNAMSSTPSLSLSSLLGSLSFSLTPHIHLTILISACWIATTFSFLTGQVSLPCNMLLHTQLLYNLPLSNCILDSN